MKTKKEEGFDYQNFEKEALAALYAGKSLEDAMGPLLKRIVEAGLQGEMQAHLEEQKACGVKNRRNGKMSKTVRSRFGVLPIETPRDREGTYEPTLLPKRDRQLGNGFGAEDFEFVRHGYGLPPDPVAPAGVVLGGVVGGAVEQHHGQDFAGGGGMAQSAFGVDVRHCVARRYPLQSTARRPDREPCGV